MLEAGRMDVILASDGVFQFKCNEYGFNPDKFEIVYVVRENPIYVAFSKAALGERGAELAEKFSMFLKKIEKNDLLKKISDSPEFSDKPM